MTGITRGRTPGRRPATALAILLVAAAMSTGAEAGEPISLPRLLNMLKDGVPESAVVALVTRDCVDFDVTSDNVSDLSSLLPSAVLDAALKCERSTPPAATPIKDPSGRLSYCSGPGELFGIQIGSTREEVVAALAALEIGENRELSLVCSRKASDNPIEDCTVDVTSWMWKEVRPDLLHSADRLVRFRLTDGRLTGILHFIACIADTSCRELEAEAREAVAIAYGLPGDKLGWFKRRMLSALMPNIAIDEWTIWRSDRFATIVGRGRGEPDDLVVVLATERDLDP